MLFAAAIVLLPDADLGGEAAEDHAVFGEHLGLDLGLALGGGRGVFDPEPELVDGGGGHFLWVPFQHQYATTRVEMQHRSDLTLVGIVVLFK